jgi:ADP-ribosylglycohydrolase
MKKYAISFPEDYVERVYSGLLGKIIGVYLGRPFEGWTYDQITARFGVIDNYVHEALGVPLIVTDDDISGTLTFIRSLPDHEYERALTSSQIAETWLNYIVENKTTLWWGGVGNSTEHTAYLKFKSGEKPPYSSSISRIGKIVAEQIGAQIFIDGWAMLCPGNPGLAVSLARKAARVSHDGEAVHAASVIAAMESLAFTEKSLDRLIESAVSYIPNDSVIYELVQDLQSWRRNESDWRVARNLLEEKYGYSKYKGNCHVVPNFGLVILSLLYGEDDFHKSLSIVNTCGWDTDCNSGNVGCIIGIKNGLACLNGSPDLRDPVSDQIYLSSADGSGAITDAVAETYRIVNIARTMAGESKIHPKSGARFHFELPGSVQGFHVLSNGNPPAPVTLKNLEGHSRFGNRSMAIQFNNADPNGTIRIGTRTFIDSPQDREFFQARGYQLLVSPTLHPGQTIHLGLQADPKNRGGIECCLFIDVFGSNDQLVSVQGPQFDLKPGECKTISWILDQSKIPGFPIARVGVEILKYAEGPNTVYLDYLTWDGVPKLVLGKPKYEGMMWRHAWVNATDLYGYRWYPESYRLIQNEGIGLLTYGNYDWSDYEIKSDITPYMVKSAGLAGRVNGLRRYYALLLCEDHKVRLVKANHDRNVLAEEPFDWKYFETYDLCIKFNGPNIRGYIDQKLIFDIQDSGHPLLHGGIGLLCEEGSMKVDKVTISPGES